MLTDLRWPDQATHDAYHYDSQNNLTEIEKPDDGTYMTCTVLPHCLPEDYNYGGTGLSNNLGMLESVESPTFATGYVTTANSSAANAGCFIGFIYSSTGAIQDVQTFGVMDPTPNDGTNTSIYGYGYGPFEEEDDRNFSTTANTTSVTDLFGHSTIYTYDANGVVSKEAQWTGSTTLTTTRSYDQNHNLIAETDPRGNETDYAYDQTGNLLAVALPSQPNEVFNSSSQTYSQASFRPTTRYAYDSTNNLIATCDPVWNHNQGGDWGEANPCVENSPGSASLTGVRQFVLQYPSAEPYGRLNYDLSATGYHLFFTYSPQSENVDASSNAIDFGLPTTIAGDQTNQLDSSSITHQTTITYDHNGNTKTFNQGFGPVTVAFNANSWVTSYTDPDNIISRYAYNNDGTLASSQTALEYQRGVATTYTYDADKDQTSQTTHHGCTASSCTPATSRRFYDGIDRLVEDAQPFDSGDLFRNVSTVGWLTRYKYDYSPIFGTKMTLQDGTVVPAFGHLYEVQEYMGNRQVTPGVTSFGSFSFKDIRGYSYDGIDRPIGAYGFEDSRTQVSTTAYDGSGQLGLRSSTTLSSSSGSIVTAYQYDTDGIETAEGYTSLGTSAATPTRSNLFDADHRHVEEDQENANGTQSFGLQYGYNADGRVSFRAELADDGKVNNSPAIMSYAYYNDGARASVSVAPNGGNWSWAFPNPMISYAYRADGAKSWERAQYDTSSTITPFTFSYSNAGRLTSRTDPVTGTTVATSNFRSSATAPLNSVAIPGLVDDGLSVGSPVSLPLVPDPGNIGAINVKVPTLVAAPIFQPAAPLEDPNPPVNPPSLESIVQPVEKQVAAATVQPYFSSFCPQNYGYDTTTGVLTSMSIGTCQSYSAINHDDEGAVSDFTGYYVPNNASYEPMHVVNSYTTRGELAGQHFYDSGQSAYDANWPHFSQAGANGFMYPIDEGAQAQVQSRTQFDVGTASVEYQAQIQYPSSTNYCGAILNDFTFERDSFGREATGIARSNGVVSSNCATHYIAGSFQRSFDARDHIVSTTISGMPPSADASTDCNQSNQGETLKTSGTVTNAFDPEDHPVVLGAESPYPVIHWDGDVPLFQTAATGSNGAIEVHELKFGYDAEKIYASTYGTQENTPTQNLFIFNRDWTGNAVLFYTGGPKWSSWLPPNPYSQACITTKAPPSDSTEQQAVIQPDTFTAETPVESPSDQLIEDGTDYVQGLRSFSPNSGAWSSADPNGGTVGDPQSLKTYLYEGGNPFDNTDPNGADIHDYPASIGPVERTLDDALGVRYIASLADPKATVQEKLVGGVIGISNILPVTEGARLGIVANRALGLAGETYVAKTYLPSLGYKVLSRQVGASTLRGLRYIDIIAQHEETGLVRAFEVKVNGSVYTAIQREKDFLIAHVQGFRLANPSNAAHSLVVDLQGQTLQTELIRLESVTTYFNGGAGFRVVSHYVI